VGRISRLSDRTGVSADPANNRSSDRNHDCLETKMHFDRNVCKSFGIRS
jgi:hypothetical protein